MSQHTITEVVFLRDVERSLEDYKPLKLHFVEKGKREEVTVQPIGKDESFGYTFVVFARIKSDLEDRTLEGTLVLELISEDVGYSAILQIE